ncbi:MAG TPA: OmpA family protein [Terriglobales bacterium]|nr:OmpA family protein [Terriglobales bacterium]
MLKQRMLAPVFALALTLPVCAQDVNNNQTPQPVNDAPLVYRVNVVERAARAVDYRHRGNVDLRILGTDLMPDAVGSAEVRPQAGRIKINAKFDRLKPPSTFGPQYLTYVLWALTPEGRPVNLGEVVLDGKDDHDAKLQVTTNLQAFGMIVTAEPYYSVTRPSNVVVMENLVGKDNDVNIEPITTHYEALDRAEYISDIKPAELPSAKADPDVPQNLLQARNAVAIAKAAGAERYAASAMQSAEDLLNGAENDYRRDHDSKDIATQSRMAAQRAEDARVIAIRTRLREQAAAERAETLRREQQAREEAKAEQLRAQEAQLQAQREQEQRRQAEQERLAAERARSEAELAAQRAATERQQAEQARQEALQQQQLLAQQAEQARLQAQQAEDARRQAELQAQQTRERLMTQLNSVLQTRETARGLIVNMSDVLFDLDKATLKPGARERLAKVAGIVMAYPDLKLDVGGFTDSTGTDSYNQKLSEDRANTVRAFLVSQGVPAENITSQGFGESQPIASNDNAAGRQLNRRVELLVSGEAIGRTNQQQPFNGNTEPAASTSGTTPTPSTQPQQPAIASPSTPR